MIRDMEELLNSVCNSKTKEYLSEALKCYNAGAYKASVIMSVNAGAYDLHQKLKDLVSDSEEFEAGKILDEDIEYIIEGGKNKSLENLNEDEKKRKKKLPQTYERYLFEQCAEKEIDMLNDYESKELIRCLNIRHDCAHPNDYNCSSEVARHIFSSIIDIVASKQGLIGNKHKDILFNEMNEKLFFLLVKPEEKVRKKIKEKISRFQKRAIKPFYDTLIGKLKNDAGKISIFYNNAMLFLAFSEEILDSEYRIVLKDFVEQDRCEEHLIKLLDMNPKILNCFSNDEIEKIIDRFNIILDNDILYNNYNVTLGFFKKIILSDTMQKDEYMSKVCKMLTDFKEKHRSSRFYVINTILEELENNDNYEELENNDNYNEETKRKFKKLIVEGCKGKFNFNDYKNIDVIKIIKELDEKDIYEEWISSIIKEFEYSYNSFNRFNGAVKILENIATWHFEDKINEDIIIRLMKSLLDEATRGNYHSYDAGTYLITLSQKYHPSYPTLHTIFIDYIFKNIDTKGAEYLCDRYKFYVSRFIISYQDKVEELIDTLVSKSANLIQCEYSIDGLMKQLKRNLEELKNNTEKEFPIDDEKINRLLEKLDSVI